MTSKLYSYAVIAFSLLLSFAPIGAAFGQDPFVTVWKTDNPGSSGNTQIELPVTGDFSYTWVNVNDTTSTGSGTGSNLTTITFPQTGTYEVQMTPTGTVGLHIIAFFEYMNNDKKKLLKVKNWGSVQWTKLQFNGCYNLKISATDTPDLSNVTDLSFTFSHCGIDTVPNIEYWDVSNVTDMGNLFESADGFNQSLANWDVSNVTDMSFMFDSATSFNQPLNTWDVSNVKSMEYMFRDALSFDQSLASWNLDSLKSAINCIIRTNMSCENYSYTLYGWANNAHTASNLYFGAYQVEYSPAVVAARNYLIDSLGWIFQSGDSLGTCTVVLGVDFKEFTAHKEQGHAVLNWETASEANNSGFEIERSADGRHWKTIGFVAAAAQEDTSMRSENYAFIDAEPLDGANYYRLKQVDFDGAFVYSVVRMLLFTEQGNAWHIYPNPAQDKVTVSGLHPNQTIQLFDIYGSALPIPTIVVRNNKAAIDLSKVTPGIYYVKVTSTTGEVTSQKLIKL